MIQFHYNPSPNPAKVALFLEEAGLPYELVPVDPRKGEQHSAAFRAINPNAKTPAIVDGDATVFDSNAILLYLADKTRRFIPQDLRGRNLVLQWLFWQMGGLGPMAGQNHHFAQYAPEPLPYAIDRYVKETSRLYGVLDKQLADGRDYIAGDYSIADIACYPWIVPHERQRQRLDDFPHLARWFERIGARPATIRAYERAKEVNVTPVVDEQSRSILFGQSAATVR
ncbi:glutathione S-transferase [Burkholderia ubonensis]|uniref:glutathione S-transferase family protein n=1 Tax=Burkholderia ubonensis TaxID=101571 RepID=UPI00075EF378|nr:glutathione S-transferase family protein [Burkholderia ubonensis]KVT91206.1 glutathione S-transferase [Burkholderia ubonensis]